MQFTITTTSGLERKIEIVIPHTRVAGEVQRRLREIARTANLKGFRPGKAPFAVIQRQYASQVQGETVSELIRESYSEAISTQNLRPASDPRIEPLSVDEGSDLRFAAIVEVLPEVTVKPVEDITVERTVPEIGESDIDAMIESMRRQRVEYSAVERASISGDRVIVDFVGRLEGVAFAGGSGTDTPFVLGAGRAIPEFEAALLGMSAGETKTAPVNFPDNYGATELAGKLAEFELTVKAVEQEVLPVVDDEFVEAFGISEGGVAKLREEVRGSMEREAAEAVRGKLRSQVFEALKLDNPLDLPRALVDEQIEALQADMMQRMGNRQPGQQLPREPFEEQARSRVLLGLLVGELIRREGIKVDRERVRAKLDEVASAYPNADEVRRAYLQNPEALRQIETAVLEDQAIDWILARARVTDRSASFAEVTGFGRQA